jgi:hypothetical protein
MIKVILVSLCLTGCTYPHVGAIPPNQDKIRLSANQAWDGLQELDHQCAEQVRNNTVLRTYLDGLDLSQRCLSVETSAEPVRQLLVQQFAHWTPTSTSKVACSMPGLLTTYTGLLTILRPMGYFPTQTVDDGRYGARWLSSLCQDK